MIKNYLKIALRNIRKQKITAGINIIGLSLGIACFTIFLFYSVNELNYDKFNKNADVTYRVYSHTQPFIGDQPFYGIFMPLPLGPAMKQDFPDVEQFVRVRNAWAENFIKVNDNDVRRIKVSFADPEFFSMFSFKFIYGNAASALSDDHSLVLTRSRAKEFFGTENVIGRKVEIKLDNEYQQFTVSAVTENTPMNSSIEYDGLCGFNYFENSAGGKYFVNNWTNYAFQTYVKLRPGSGLPGDLSRLSSLYKKYYPNYESEMAAAGAKWDRSKPLSTYALQPLLSIHNDIRLAAGGGTTDPKTIWILMSIAAGVLLIACINFTTLATGRFAGRTKEVGIRKVIGGQRKQLIFQFLTEALVLAVLSAIIGLGIASLLLPYFNQLSGKSLSFSFATYPQIAGILVGVTLLTGLLAGSYPAWVLSGFNPGRVLKSKVRIGGSNLFTKSLVTLQFALSAALIICTVVILKQTKYLGTKDPGFNKENVVMVDASDIDARKVYPLFKQLLQSNPAVAGIAGAEYGLGEGEGWMQVGFDVNGKQKNAYQFYVDHDYVNVMGMKLAAGRNFDPNNSQDTVNSIIINEAMMKDLGWTIKDAIGQQLKEFSKDRTPVIIGVVRDFNFFSLKQTVQPQMFMVKSLPYRYFVRIKPGNASAAIAGIENTWKKLVPDYPIRYSFLDEKLDNFYKSEKRWSSIVGWAGGISIFLACLGLFGLIALAAVNRTKEIGIRKVLGASITGIVALLSKDFLKLVAIAFVIAAPVAWYFMDKWLQDYPYRIHIGWTVFAITGFFIMAIALITLSFQAIRAAIANPVKSLRTE